MDCISYFVNAFRKPSASLARDPAAKMAAAAAAAAATAAINATAGMKGMPPPPSVPQLAQKLGQILEPGGEIRQQQQRLAARQRQQQLYQRGPVSEGHLLPHSKGNPAASAIATAAANAAANAAVRGMVADGQRVRPKQQFATGKGLSAAAPAVSAMQVVSAVPAAGAVPAVSAAVQRPSDAERRERIKHVRMKEGGRGDEEVD